MYSVNKLICTLLFIVTCGATVAKASPLKRIEDSDAIAKTMVNGLEQFKTPDCMLDVLENPQHKLNQALGYRITAISLDQASEESDAVIRFEYGSGFKKAKRVVSITCELKDSRESIESL